MAFAVGLTGGIGSGKTTVAALFALQGAGLVDTDEISHRLTAPAQPAIAEIARKFGPQFVAEDGSLEHTADPGVDGALRRRRGAAADRIRGLPGDDRSHTGGGLRAGNPSSQGDGAKRSIPK